MVAELNDQEEQILKGVSEVNETDNIQSQEITGGKKRRKRSTKRKSTKRKSTKRKSTKKRKGRK